MTDTDIGQFMLTAVVVPMAAGLLRFSVAYGFEGRSMSDSVKVSCQLFTIAAVVLGIRVMVAL